MTTRRDFLKTAGVLTAASAFLKPSDIFAQKNNPPKISKSKKLQLDWENFDGVMKFTFTISWRDTGVCQRFPKKSSRECPSLI